VTRQDENLVLVVNDAPEQLELMSLMLSRAGYNVLNAADGREGFEAARKARPDLVISDVRMPLVDGIELCRMIRAQPGLSTTPLLLVSAERKDSQSVVEGLEAGADDYLEAPYDPAQLVAKVVRLLERRRRERQIRFQAGVLSQVSDAVIAIDKERRITYWNAASERLYGFGAVEVLGRALEEVSGCGWPKPEDEEAAWESLAATGAWHGENVHRTRGGAEICVDSSVSVLRDECGKAAGLLAVIRDITKRKRIEEELRQSERLLAEAQHLARVGSWSWDLLNNSVTWSDELYRIYELHPREFVPTYEGFLKIVHPEDRDFLARVVEGSLRRRQPFSLYARVTRADGEVRVMYFRGSVVADERGRPVRMFGTSQDVTERKLAEEQLRSSNEKLRALAARLQSVREEEAVRIAREIHDELGGALTGLKFDSSWLARRLSGPNLEEKRQKLEAMSALIDETIQKVRNISTELRPSVLDDLGLAAAIEWQAREFQRRTEIECRIDSLEEAFGLGPEKSAAVFRIFQEILTNVARHSGASRVRISLKEREGSLVLTVSDNGVGISEADISDTKSLGLLGMRERALVFGGSVEFGGEERRGTTVTVSIPHE
jgi:PAS domain S-box-containing protein